MMRGGKLLPAVLPALLLVACNTQPKHDPPPQQDGIDDKPLHLKTEEIHVELIQQMLDKGQYYAALAHIEEAKRAGSSDQLRLLEADARRHLGQTAQAETLYRGLLATQFAAAAYHGLGILYADTDLDAAIGNLQRAVERAPTNVDFRNDLGYALMTAGRYTEAMPELSTAAELAPAQTRSRKNLIILMILVGNENAAMRLRDDAGVSPEGMRQLRDTATTIRNRQNARAAKPAGQGQ
jgi:tetratricopeptide (TPR) repeat protein